MDNFCKEPHKIVIHGKKNIIVINLITREVMLSSNSKLDSVELLTSKQRENIYNLYLDRLNSLQSISVWLFLTYSCELACTYCFENKTNTYCNEFMTEKIIDQAISSLLKLATDSTKLYELVYFGGEPLLNYKILEYAIYQFNEKLGRTVAHKLITNGYSLSQSRIHKLLELGLGTIQITLDGYKEENDKRRMTKKLQGSFDIIKMNIMALLKEPKNFTLIIRMNVDKSNMHSIRRFIDEEEAILSDHRVYLDIGKVSTHNFEFFYSDYLSRHDFSKFYNEIINYIYMKGLKAVPPFHGGCSLNHRSSLFLSPQGEVFKCPTLVGTSSKKIGSIWSNKIIDGGANKEGLLKECYVCKFLLLCEGGCKMNATGNNEVICNKKYIEKDLVSYYSAKYHSYL